MLKQIGFDVEVAYFERDYHKGRTPDCKCTSLGKIEHGKYFSRIFIFLKSLFRLRRMSKNFDLLYCSGPDMAYFSMVSTIGLGIPKVMEVGDLREIQFRPNLVGACFRLVEKTFVRKCKFIVTTSEGFIDGYYKNLDKNLDYLVLENKLEKRPLESQEQNPARKNDDVIRIGYFGLLRCNWSWKVLSALAEKNPDRFEIFVAGYDFGLEGFEKDIDRLDNIEYYGTYKSPQDLYTLYSQIDLVWGVFPIPTKPSDQNWKWAKTNRFYESLYYKKPLVVLDGSGDAPAVNSLDVGVNIKRDSVANAVSFLEKLNLEDIQRLEKNAEEVPEHIYMYNQEYEQLKEKILSVLIKD